MLSGKTKPIRGTILNEDGEKISDVNVVSLPSGQGTKSNSDGVFYLQTPIKDRELSLNHIGYESVVLNIILFENRTDIILKKKILPMDSLEVTADSRRQFDLLKDNNNVVFIKMDDVSLRGAMDLGDALFSDYPVLLNESLDGKKSISVRSSSAEEMVYLYDGVRINNMSDALMDLSQMTTLGLSGMELVLGGHQKALSSSGTINFIPKLTYKKSFLFNQQFGTYNYGGYDGFGSMGFKYGTVNLGNSQAQMSQVYIDTNAAEIKTLYDRYYVNIGIKKSKDLELKIMAFQNNKLFQNFRTNDSVDAVLQNVIIKMENYHSLRGDLSFFSLFQNKIGKENIGFEKKNKKDNTAGIGFEYEKIIDNSKIHFSTETHLSKVNWNLNNTNLISDRQSSIFTGSFELYQKEDDKKYQFKDLKFIFSKHRVTDISDTSNGYYISGNSWDNNNTQFSASLLNKQPNRILSFYANLGNVFRVPSVSELIHNQVNPVTIGINKLLPEQKTMYEFGVKINNHRQIEGPYYNAIISGFSYQYFNKIKQIYFSGNPMKYPINYGQASISGVEMSLSYQPKRDWISIKSHITNYFFSDVSAFQLQPSRMARNIIFINTAFFNVEFVHRSESSRQITTIGENEILQNTLRPITNFDIYLYRNFQVSFFKSSVSLSAKNLNSTPEYLEGISIHDRRYSLSISIALK